MTPSCPKCSGTSFSLEELKVQKSAYRIFGVCCTHCGAVVGTQDYYNIGSLIHNLAKKLNVNLD
jgi:hypothetical protein